MPSAATPTPHMIHFGTVAHALLREQTQYAYRYLEGLHGDPELGAGLRFYTDPHGCYHSTRIHPDDVAEFVFRVAHYRANAHCIGFDVADRMVAAALVWSPVAEDFET